MLYSRSVLRPEVLADAFVAHCQERGLDAPVWLQKATFSRFGGIFAAATALSLVRGRNSGLAAVIDFATAFPRAAPDGLALARLQDTAVVCKLWVMTAIFLKVVIPWTRGVAAWAGAERGSVAQSPVR